MSDTNIRKLSVERIKIDKLEQSGDEILPTFLTCAIGLNNAFLVQTLYNTLKNGTIGAEIMVDSGKFWAKITLKEWAKKIPFASSRSSQRWLKELEDVGLLLVSDVNAPYYETGKYYSICEEKLEELYKE